MKLSFLVSLCSVFFSMNLYANSEKFLNEHDIKNEPSNDKQKIIEYHLGSLTAVQNSANHNINKINDNLIDIKKLLTTQNTLLSEILSKNNTALKNDKSFVFVEKNKLK